MFRVNEFDAKENRNKQAFLYILFFVSFFFALNFKLFYFRTKANRFSLFLDEHDFFFSAAVDNKTETKT